MITIKSYMGNLYRISLFETPRHVEYYIFGLDTYIEWLVVYDNKAPRYCGTNAIYHFLYLAYLAIIQHLLYCNAHGNSFLRQRPQGVLAVLP